MSETKCTPGPWSAERGNTGSQHRLFVVAPNEDGLLPWRDSDAHLIAAAPDLYAALNALMAHDQMARAFDPEVQLAKRALAKARGEA